MNDTPAVIEDELRRRLRARSPLDRVRMSAHMFATAKTLAGAGLRLANPMLSHRELRYGLLLRLHGDALSEHDRTAIADSTAHRAGR